MGTLLACLPSSGIDQGAESDQADETEAISRIPTTLLNAIQEVVKLLQEMILPEPVNFRHVDTRAPGPKCPPRVPKDGKCELREHYCAQCNNKNRWLDVLIDC